MLAANWREKANNMDQLKEILGVLKRQHFWFIAPLLLVIGLVGWMMANKQLTQEYERNKVTVNGYISQMQTVSRQQPHPNDEYKTGMEQLIEQRRDNVRAAWQRKWERQQKELKWPEDLPADFIRVVEGMRPIETVDVKSNNIIGPLRATYGSFIKEMLPRLAKRIGAKWQPARVGTVSGFSVGAFREGSRGEPRREVPAEGAVEEEPTIIDWNAKNQGEIQQRFDWGSRSPSTLEVLYAQEDLWVLTTLADIIQRTNGQAMTRSQAAIKGIEFIQLGKDVIPPSQQGFKVVRPQPLGGEDKSSTEEDDAATSKEEKVDFGPDTVHSDEAATSGDAQPAQNIDLDLVKNRYYNDKYEPIADLNSLMNSVAVAKRIPVRIRLLMDQRQIGKLLVECANAPLTFEVRQLRFNPQGVRAGLLGEAFAETTVNTENALLTRAPAVKTLADYQSFDRTVELFGIIYIFNPVDEAILGGEKTAESVAPEDDDTAARHSNQPNPA
jgi:hypothetical protein